VKKLITEYRVFGRNLSLTAHLRPEFKAEGREQEWLLGRKFAPVSNAYPHHLGNLESAVSSLSGVQLPDRKCILDALKVQKTRNFQAAEENVALLGCTQLLTSLFLSYAEFIYTHLFVKWQLWKKHNLQSRFLQIRGFVSGIHALYKINCGVFAHLPSI